MTNKVAFTGHMIIDVATGEGKLAVITVFIAGTENLATIYSSPEGAALSNPFNTDANGRFDFYADEGEYDVQVSGVGITTYKIEDVSIIGYADEFLKGSYVEAYRAFVIDG